MTCQSVRTAARLLILALSCAVLAGCGDDHDSDEPREIVTLGGADHQILDTEYEARRYFSLTDPWDGATHVSVENLEVFITTRDEAFEIRNGRQVYDVAGTRHGDTSDVLDMDKAVRLTPNDDFYAYISQTFDGTLIILRTELPENRRLYAAWRNANQTTSEVGNFFSGPPEGDPVRVKVLAVTRADFEGSAMSAAWRREVLRLERRQVYRLDAPDIDTPTLQLHIRQAGDSTDIELDGQSPLSVLGLDIINNLTGLDCTQSGPPGLRGADGLIDPWVLEATVGVLLFPDTQPFAPGLGDLVDDIPQPPIPSCRPRALGWRLNGTAYEPVSPADLAAETNPALYDRFRPTAADSRYVITGQFEEIPAP